MHKSIRNRIETNTKKKKKKKKRGCIVPFDRALNKMHLISVVSMHIRSFIFTYFQLVWTVMMVWELYRFCVHVCCVLLRKMGNTLSSRSLHRCHSDEENGKKYIFCRSSRNHLRKIKSSILRHTRNRTHCNQSVCVCV